MNPNHDCLKEAASKVQQWYSQAFEQNDPSVLTDHYSMKCCLMPNGDRLISSKEGHNEYWQKTFDSGFVKPVVVVAELEQHSEDYGTEIGTFVINGKSEKGEFSKRGKYVRVWKREEGEWRIHRNIYNFDS